MYIIRIRRETTTAQRLGRNLFGRRSVNYYLRTNDHRSSYTTELIRIVTRRLASLTFDQPGILMNEKAKENYKGEVKPILASDSGSTTDLDRASLVGGTCMS